MKAGDLKPGTLIFISPEKHHPVCYVTVLDVQPIVRKGIAQVKLTYRWNDIGENEGHTQSRYYNQNKELLS